MRQMVRPGGYIEAVTPDEMFRLIPRPRDYERMRVPGSVLLNASGAGDDEIYKVPIGMEFAARRVVLTLAGNVPVAPSGAVPISATAFVAYTRSGQLIEYGQPQYGAAYQVPGVQTWGDQQGPYLRNGEVFGVVAGGLTANTVLNVYLEGLLYDLTGSNKRTIEP